MCTPKLSGCDPSRRCPWPAAARRRPSCLISPRRASRPKHDPVAPSVLHVQSAGLVARDRVGLGRELDPGGTERSLDRAARGTGGPHEGDREEHAAGTQRPADSRSAAPASPISLRVPPITTASAWPSSSGRSWATARTGAIETPSRAAWRRARRKKAALWSSASTWAPAVARWRAAVALRAADVDDHRPGDIGTETVAQRAVQLGQLLLRGERTSRHPPDGVWPPEPLVQLQLGRHRVGELGERALRTVAAHRLPDAIGDARRILTVRADQGRAHDHAGRVDDVLGRREEREAAGVLDGGPQVREQSGQHEGHRTRCPLRRSLTCEVREPAPRLVRARSPRRQPGRPGNERRRAS